MKGRAHAGPIAVGLLIVMTVAVFALAALAQPTTYAGVTFPQGDVAFADRVVDYVAASCVRDAYDDPEEALGPPDACPNCQGCGGCSTNAVSLGFRVSELDTRGYLVLEFVDNLLVDVSGDDLFVYITNNRQCRVEISTDGINFIQVGEVTGYPAAIDISPYAASGAQYRFVRLTDVAADEDHSDCPGPSIDAVGAMGPVQEAFTGEAFGSLELQPVGELAFAVGSSPNSLLIVLDASSSMSEKVDGEVKIDVAKDVLVGLLDDMPDGAMIGMRYFQGCENSPLITPIAPLDRDFLEAAILKIQPRGTTPIAYTLEQTKGDFAGIEGTKMILLVTDGMETCGGDPVAAAQDLLSSGYDLRINVVGFDIGRNSTARDQLVQIAEATGGAFYQADNREELREALSLTAPFSYTVYDQDGNVVYTGRLGGDTAPQLPAGTYRVVIGTTPQIVLDQVVVEDQQTTTITVEKTNGGYQADIGG
jgi:hypothetical protein